MINDDDGQFQRVQPLVKVEEKVKNNHQRYEQSNEVDQFEQTRGRGWDFLQANPILPPGKYQFRQQPKLKLKNNGRDKFHRSTFVGNSLKTKIGMNSQNPNGKNNSFSLGKDKSMQDQQMQQQEQNDPELRAVLENKVQVYRRINNSSMNSLGKERQRVLCSVFFDWKKQKIKGQQEPILEHLSKIMKIRIPKSQSHWLTFNSSFQSGNLFLAVHNPKELLPTYELYMQNDINTKGCTQWYYFSVINKTRGKAKLKIKNFYKPTSLYQKGMKVLCSFDKIQWKRTGTSISYFKDDEGRNSYALEFIHEFDVPGRTTYFSYGYPYTYSGHLNAYIQNLFNEPRFSKLMRKSNLCLSAMGNPIPMLSISNYLKKQQRPIIYIIGRQHPGQTPASFIVEGIMNFLLCPSIQAKELRDKFQFRVVPMVNVDGVISGNYRSNLSGSDVNRQWYFPSKKGQPQIFWLKQEIYSNKKNAVFFLDVHAHSRKMNSFFYGSKSAQKDSKLYPFVCSKLNKFISYNESSFTDDPSKKTTARVILQTQVNIPHSLTFQTSFYGWVDNHKGIICSFKQNDLRMIGESLGMGFYYNFIGVQKAKKNDNGGIFKGSTQKEKLLMKNSIKMLEKWNKQLQKEAAELLEEDQVFSQGSSLDPEHFQLKEQERQFVSEMTKIQSEKLAQHLGEPLSRDLSTPKTKQQPNKNQRMLIYSTLSPSQANDSKLLTRRDPTNTQTLGFSSNQFYQISTTSPSHKKKPFSVRQLQLELQCSNQISPQRRLRGVKLKMQEPMSSLARYQSLDINRSERVKNYKEDVLEMKRALKYLLETKGSDYEQYRSCFKSYTNENMGNTLSKNQRKFNNK